MAPLHSHREFDKREKKKIERPRYFSFISDDEVEPPYQSFSQFLNISGNQKPNRKSRPGYPRIDTRLRKALSFTMETLPVLLTLPSVTFVSKKQMRNEGRRETYRVPRDDLR